MISGPPAENNASDSLSQTKDAKWRNFEIEYVKKLKNANKQKSDLLIIWITEYEY